MNRTRDSWGDPAAPKKARDAWGDSPKPGRDPWGDPAKPARPAPFPEAATQFAPVDKIEGGRRHDPWGAEVPEQGMPAREFAHAIAEAQVAIFEKARPSRPSDRDAAAYVDAMTAHLRKESASDAEFIEKLRACGSWSHQRPTTAKAGASR